MPYHVPFAIPHTGPLNWRILKKKEVEGRLGGNE